MKGWVCVVLSETFPNDQSEDWIRYDWPIPARYESPHGLHYPVMSRYTMSLVITNTIITLIIVQTPPYQGEIKWCALLCYTDNSHGVGGNKCIYCKLGRLGYVSPLPIRGSRIIGHYTLINYLTQTEINPDNFTRFSYCKVSAPLRVFSVHSICHA